MMYEYGGSRRKRYGEPGLNGEIPYFRRIALMGEKVQRNGCGPARRAQCGKHVCLVVAMRRLLQQLTHMSL